ncbi:MAG: hypothetical protein ACPGYX_01175, partial [Oceanobacter sp.]
MLTISVDAMGGDLGPRVAFKACEKILTQRKNLAILLFVELNTIIRVEFIDFPANAPKASYSIFNIYRYPNGILM